MKKIFLFQLDLVFYPFSQKGNNSSSTVSTNFYIPGKEIITLFKKIILEQEKIFFFHPTLPLDPKKKASLNLPNSTFNLGLEIISNEHIPYLILSDEYIAKLNNEKESKNKVLYFFWDKNNINQKKKLVELTSSVNFRAQFFSFKKTSDKMSSGLVKKVNSLLKENRIVKHERNTNETKIKIKLNLDGKGQNLITTGIGFFDHMLDLLGKHAGYDLFIKVKGDLKVDEHHTIEDTAIVLGEAIKKALGNKRGIGRYAFILPMDESEAKVLLDISNRPFLKFNGKFNREKVGDFPTEMVKHFFYSLALAAGLTLHLEIKGENDHHKIEGAFKAVARCLGLASEIKHNQLPSTKGIL